MLREFGGVVGPALRVYRVRRLRVVDASVIPVIPAADIQATMYAVAEKVSSAFCQVCSARSRTGFRLRILLSPPHRGSNLL